MSSTAPYTLQPLTWRVRLLTGVAAGLGLCVGPIYISEIAPSKIKGAVGSSAPHKTPGITLIVRTGIPASRSAADIDRELLSRNLMIFCDSVICIIFYP